MRTNLIHISKFLLLSFITISFLACSSDDGYVGEEPSEGTSITTPEGYHLVWNQEFNNKSDSQGRGILPSSDWYYDIDTLDNEKPNGWGNKELQYYIPAVNEEDTCAVISDGTLKIRLKKDYYSGKIMSVRMNSKKSWKYGYFEARIKMPFGKGVWPAFWMLPADFTGNWPQEGEIDIVESCYNNSTSIKVQSAIHCNAYNFKSGNQKNSSKNWNDDDVNAFHTYAMEWTPYYIKTIFDGDIIFTYFNGRQSDSDYWPYNKPFRILLNMAWGGSMGGTVDESILPISYEIDYIRVFQK